MTTDPEDAASPALPLQGCPHCGTFARARGRACPHCGHALVKGSRWLRKLARIPGIVTWTLLGVFGLLYAIECGLQHHLFGSFAPSGGGALPGIGGVSGVTIRLLGSNDHAMVLQHGQWWRLATAAYLHLGVIHIAFNGMVLHSLGIAAESFWGKARYWSAFVLAGAGSNLISLAYYGLVRGVPVNAAGGSGAIFGLLGMLLAYAYRHPHRMDEGVRQRLKRWAVFALLFGVFVGADNAAHMGGLVCGLALGYGLADTRDQAAGSRFDKLWSAIALACVVLTLVCMGFAARFCVQWTGEVRQAIAQERGERGARGSGGGASEGPAPAGPRGARVAGGAGRGREVRARAGRAGARPSDTICARRLDDAGGSEGPAPAGPART